MVTMFTNSSNFELEALEPPRVSEVKENRSVLVYLDINRKKNPKILVCRQLKNKRDRKYRGMVGTV